MCRCLVFWKDGSALTVKMGIVVKLFLAVFLGAVANAAKSIQCWSNCYKKQEAILLRDGSYLTCRIEATKYTPLSTEADVSPETPKFLTADWYVHQNKRIALKISWVHKEVYIKTRRLKGFLLLVEYSGTLIKYVATTAILDKPANSMIIINVTKEDPYIMFNFQCYGQMYQLIRAGETRIVSLYSIPLPAYQYKMYKKDQTVQIPDCMDQKRGRELIKIRNREIVKNWKLCNKIVSERKYRQSPPTTPSRKIDTTYFDVEEELETLYDDAFLDTTPEYWKIKILKAVAVVLLITIIVLLVFTVRSRRLKKQPTLLPATVLILADIANREVVEKSYKLSTFLQDNFNVTVITNWEEREKIRLSPSVNWYNNVKSDIVIFIKLEDDFQAEKLFENRKNSQKTAEEFPSEMKMVENYLLGQWDSSKRDIIFLVKNPVAQNVPKRGRKFEVYAFKEKYSEKDDFYSYFVKFTKVNCDTNYARSGARPKKRIPLLEAPIRVTSV